MRHEKQFERGEHDGLQLLVAALDAQRSGILHDVQQLAVQMPCHDKCRATSEGPDAASARFWGKTHEPDDQYEAEPGDPLHH